MHCLPLILQHIYATHFLLADSHLNHVHSCILVFSSSHSTHTHTRNNSIYSFITWACTLAYSHAHTLTHLFLLFIKVINDDTNEEVEGEEGSKDDKEDKVEVHVEVVLTYGLLVDLWEQGEVWLLLTGYPFFLDLNTDCPYSHTLNK